MFLPEGYDTFLKVTMLINLEKKEKTLNLYIFLYCIYFFLCSTCESEAIAIIYQVNNEMYEIICNPSVPSGRNWKHLRVAMSVACVVHIELSGVVKYTVLYVQTILYRISVVYFVLLQLALLLLFTFNSRSDKLSED